MSNKVKLKYCVNSEENKNKNLVQLVQFRFGWVKLDQVVTNTKFSLVGLDQVWLGWVKLDQVRCFRFCGVLTNNI